MLFRLVCLFCILYFGDNFCSSEDVLPEVVTPLGRVQGFWKTVNNRRYAAYEGIPYAKPPVGDLRFEEPEPISAWSGTWEANTLRTCMQAQLFSDNEIYGEEDCLYLNVYVPEEFVENTNGLDVIVSVHGGAFMIGSGHMGLNTLPDKDLVMVSFNYRLGILGFLSTEDSAIPGNNGLKDQVLAFKWVKDNIASFGGNPDSVTLVGLSAGAASVHLHYFSPLSKGLFVRGLSHSGTALAPWVVRKNALERTKKLAVLVGCAGSQTEELKSCLKQKSAHTLLGQLKHFYGFHNLPFSPFAPVVEKKSPNAFLEDEPYQLLKEGKVLDVPWITSYAADDGLLPSALFWQNLDQLNEKWLEVAPFVLDYNDTVPISKKEIVGKEVLEYYLGQGEDINRKNFKKFTQMFTDRLFGISAETSVKLQSKVTKSPVYLYKFNYEGENKITTFLSNSDEIEGVGHGDDGIYFYGIFATKPFSEQDKKMIAACQNVLYSYATAGNPSFDGTDTWKPTESEEVTYLVVNGPDNYELRTAENLTPSDFWDRLGFLENENLVVKDELYEDDLPEVTTPLGTVQGFWKTVNDRKYAAFEGIPYGKPPEGDLRFEEPEPVSAWSGTLEANTPRTCLQLALEDVLGEEDCLCLNVYIPAESVENPDGLDVIVSVHGGAFMVGNGHAEFTALPDKDLVIVTLNYRLGILGFLSTEDSVIPGNNGLKDQVLALRWVKDNIASFGGNPDTVTLVGLSAGGASVHFHYFSPLSKGLFVRGLSQSGTALSPWVLKKNARRSAKKLAVLVGCPDSPTEELKRCLKQRPAHTLLKQLEHFYGFNYLPFSPFAPVVERGSPNAFLDGEPYQLLKQGKVLDVPWITSYAADDGLLPSSLFWQSLDQVNEKWVEVAPFFLDYNDTVPISTKEVVAKEVLEYYLGQGEEIDRKNFNKFTQMLTDRLFGIPAETAAKLQAKVTKSPVYFYIFNYKGVNRMASFFSRTEEVEGVCHADDGIYFYGMFAFKPFSEQDKKMSAACHNVLYSYATNNNPSFDGTDTWKPTGSEDLTYLVVNGPDNYDLKRAENLTPSDFWSKFRLLENENLVVKDEL